MKTLAATLLSGCLALAATSAFGVDDMKNHRLSSSPSALFCVVIGRACRWPLPCRVVNIANLMSLIIVQSLSRDSLVSFMSSAFESRPRRPIERLQHLTKRSPVRQCRTGL